MTVYLVYLVKPPSQETGDNSNISKKLFEIVHKTKIFKFSIMKSHVKDILKQHIILSLIFNKVTYLADKLGGGT